MVEDCVNAVGVDVNTASAPLLARVSGIGAGLAQHRKHRDAQGPFASRKELKKGRASGPKAFEHCAGFLRIRGNDPLDAGVHPESYPVVRRILAATSDGSESLIGERQDQRCSAGGFIDDVFGVPTVTDILRDWKSPDATRGRVQGPQSSRRE